MKSSTAKIKSLVPLHEVEPGAVAQLYDVAQYDFVKRIAVMPDIHQGYFLPIGTVALIEEHIAPEAVGYDIGCGMCFVNTGVLASDIIKDMRDKKRIHDDIKYGDNKIPVGFDKRSSVHPDAGDFVSAIGDRELSRSVDFNNKMQLGTLGGK